MKLFVCFYTKPECKSNSHCNRKRCQKSEGQTQSGVKPDLFGLIFLRSPASDSKISSNTKDSEETHSNVYYRQETATSEVLADVFFVCSKSYLNNFFIFILCQFSFFLFSFKLFNKLLECFQIFLLNLFSLFLFWTFIIDRSLSLSCHLSMSLMDFKQLLEIWIILDLRKWTLQHNFTFL